MKKTIVGFLAAALFAPVAVFATSESCRGIDECGTTESKIAALQAQILQLTQLLTQLIVTKNTPAPQSVTWGGVTMNFPKNWTIVINRPETSNDFSATLKDSNGSTVALLNKFFGGGDVPYTLIASEQMTSGSGIKVQKAIFHCEGSICADGTKGLVLYRLDGISGESIWIQVPVNATSYYRNIEAAKNAIDEWVKTMKYAVATTTSTSCFVPTYDLYIGRTDVQTNGEVTRLQMWLKAEGVFPDATGSGYYGEKTAAAVMKWQKANGMDFVTLKSGVGKQTRAKMQEKCSGTSSEVRETISGIINTSNQSGLSLVKVTEKNRIYRFEDAGDLERLAAGKATPKSTSCHMEIPVTVTIANPQFVSAPISGTGTASDPSIYSARAVRVISTGIITDVCQIYNPSGGYSIERTIRQ